MTSAESKNGAAAALIIFVRNPNKTLQAYLPGAKADKFHAAAARELTGTSNE
jgi:hypothetical protein